MFGYLVGILPFGILLLKGRGWWFLGAAVLSIIPIIGLPVVFVMSMRLARPNSWWARHRYGSTKMRESRDRFADAPERPSTVLAALGWFVLLGLAPALGVVALTL